MVELRDRRLRRTEWHDGASCRSHHDGSLVERPLVECGVHVGRKSRAQAPVTDVSDDADDLAAERLPVLLPAEPETLADRILAGEETARRLLADEQRGLTAR